MHRGLMRVLQCCLLGNVFPPVRGLVGLTFNVGRLADGGSLFSYFMQFGVVGKSAGDDGVRRSSCLVA
jgi:hypothetical protein